MGHIHIEISSPFIILSSKMKGYNLQQPRYTSSSHSHTVSHTIIEIVLQCYNTIHSHITMLSFYRGITMRKCYRSPNTMGSQTVGQQTSQKNSFGFFAPKSPFSGVLPLNPYQGPASPRPPSWGIWTPIRGRCPPAPPL